MQCSNLILTYYKIWYLGSHADDYEHRLMRDLFDGYNKDSRPVFNKSKAVDVQLDVAFSQLVELVGDFLISLYIRFYNPILKRKHSGDWSRLLTRWTSFLWYLHMHKNLLLLAKNGRKVSDCRILCPQLGFLKDWKRDCQYIFMQWS